MTNPFFYIAAGPYNDGFWPGLTSLVQAMRFLPTMLPAGFGEFDGRRIVGLRSRHDARRDRHRH